MSHRRYAELSAGDADDIDRAVAAAAAPSRAWSAISARQRSDVLRRIAESIERRADVIADFESFDTGQPVSQARGPAARAAENFRYFSEVCGTIHEDAFRRPTSSATWSAARRAWPA